MTNILVVAAHPDDEVLGCGGTIAKHADEGDRVNILIVAEGATSRQLNRDREEVKEELSILMKAANNAAKILGAQSVKFMNQPDNRLDSLDRLDLIKKIEVEINHYEPEVVYVHHAGDVNIDHRRIHEAVITAARPTPNQRIKSLLSFEVASSTEWQPPHSAPSFQPNWFVEITEQLTRKMLALEMYAAEMRPWPHARSTKALKHLAHWRGAQVGVEAAEAFNLMRRLR